MFLLLYKRQQHLYSHRITKLKYGQTKTNVANLPLTHLAKIRNIHLCIKAGIAIDNNSSITSVSHPLEEKIPILTAHFCDISMKFILR